MTTPNIEELINNLTIKAGVMEMGEKIAWGSDTALMRQAAATLQSQAEPMTDPCKTCSHFQEGKLPGVRIHDETCYECRSYWGNKWGAA